MSDRYKQTSLFNIEEPELGQAVNGGKNLSDRPIPCNQEGQAGKHQNISDVESLTESPMYPNFFIGDQVTGSNYKGENLIGTISYLSNFGFAVIWNGRTKETHYDLKDANSIIKKVRVHQALEAESEIEVCQDKAPVYHYEIKEIKGRFYKYMRWWDGDRHRSKYVGKASNFHAP